ncbi:hypothetical protein QTO30_19660 [Yoonia sp. GPGPB17]|uniref:hypothetical protein n=1 Tax=Yoonia sp. GPGPB17 TaxID=3026147 RepID=UPI0030C3A836
MSNSSYELCDVLGDGLSTKIDELSAHELMESYKFLVSMNEIEELFALVSACYADFESNLFTVALEHHVHGENASSEPIELSIGKKKDRIRQTVLSLLTAYRALCDQAPQRLDGITAGNSALDTEFKRQISVAFDASFEFRLFDALRNIMTHKVLPFSNAGITSKFLVADWEDIENSEVVSISVQELPVPKEVWVDSNIRKKTRTEVAALDSDLVDMKAVVRGFVSALFKMRKEFHETTEGQMAQSKAAFESAYDVFRERHGVAARFLELWGGSEGTYSKMCPIKRTFAELVDEQRRYSSGLPNVGMSYPTVEITKRQNTYQGNFGKLWKR